jgi:hypothetical protein
MLYHCWLTVLPLILIAAPVAAADQAPLAETLGREVVGPRQSLLDAQEYIVARLPRVPAMKSVAEWDDYARRLRADVLARAVFRGEAARWRDAKLKVEWQDTISGGPGYRIKKLRYEAVPGLWIPALLYEPEKISAKMPLSLAVNGHDRQGKAAPYKQMRCINMAKRGLCVLNVEWLNMGQLRAPGFDHYKLNQLDLCGTSGVAVFYFAMARGLDVLLGQRNADPARVVVSGLSGGGWQTIFISSLDPRVTLANPVAGYSGFRTRVQKAKDLGDSEQTPCDLAAVADYEHLTALLAPRPALLTYNAKDDCCFEAGYALPPLLNAARPIYKLHGKEANLRSHINIEPGTHNFEKDNREALYRALGAYFFAGDASFSAVEIPSQKELKTAEELRVELPAKNADLHSLALDLARRLPHAAELPTTAEGARAWQTDRRAKLREVVMAKDFKVEARRGDIGKTGDTQVTPWKLRLGGAWTVPVVELSRGTPEKTVILLNDSGRKADPVNAERLLAAGFRVLATDLWYFGESRLAQSDFLYALMLASLGDRPLGLQASELAAVARWARDEFKTAPSVTVVGPRTGLIALVAAGLEEKAIAGLELHSSLASLKEILERDRTVATEPEWFCFGLLEAFDVQHLAALAAPRPLKFLQPTDRAKKELAGLKAWYGLLGHEMDPLR